MKTNKELRRLIHTVLDCQTHFHKPRIIETDKDFRLGKGAIVICQECVERLLEAIDLAPDEPVGSPQQFSTKEWERKKARTKIV